MKSLKIGLVLLVLVACISSCGGRKDRCPSVGKVSTIERTVIA